MTSRREAADRVTGTRSAACEEAPGAYTARTTELALPRAPLPAAATP
jgi:hypothetical protein